MDILMPQLGETVTEGKITAWFKSIGDTVGPGDNLFEIETDKVSMEVPATAAGVLTEIRVAAGEAAPVGAVVAVLDAAAGVSAAAPDRAPSAPAREPPTVVGVTLVVPRQRDLPADPAPSSGLRGANEQPPARVQLDPFREVRTPERNYGPARLANGAIATPLARRLAGEAGIDLARVELSGPHGRITGRDVQATIDHVSALYDGFGRRRVKPQPPKPDPDIARVLYPPGSGEDVPLDAARRANVARLVEAVHVPQFRLTADLAIDRLEEIRNEANASALPDQAGNPAFRLFLEDFMVRALALALARVPAANAVWAEDRLLRFKRSDLAIGITTPDGLVLPVIRGADRKPLRDIAAEHRELASRARAGKLEAAELQGGASAVCALTAQDVHAFDLMVAPPHASMLAVGSPARRPIETADGGLRFVTQITVTLACDQRVIDAALSAELLGALRHFIEHPVGLMI